MNLLKTFQFVFMALIVTLSNAQNVYISTEQELNFGDFYLSGNAGGKVTVSSSGTWSSSGEIHLLNPYYQSAAFTLSTDSLTPVLVQIETPVTVLTNKKGEKISLQLDTSGITQYTLQQGFPKKIFLGGTLIIDPNLGSSPGNYNGQVQIIANIYNE